MTDKRKRWIGQVSKLDDFGGPITTRFYDGRIANRLTWAIMNPTNWLVYGCGMVGQGHAQLYQKDPADGVFYKIGG
jgi:hypothetical protein